MIIRSQINSGLSMDDKIAFPYGDGVTEVRRRRK